MKFFIKRPVAVEQFRQQAGYPDDADPVQIEEELRAALADSAKKFYGRLQGRQVFRIQIPNRNTVYAIGDPPKPGKEYDAVITSVKSEEEHRQETRQELRRTRKAQTAFIRYPNGDGKPRLEEHPVDQIPGKIMELLRNGLKDHQIEVLKPVPWTLDITLAEFAA